MSKINWTDISGEGMEYAAQIGVLYVRAGINDGGCPFYSLGSAGGYVGNPLPQAGVTNPMAYAKQAARNMQVKAEVAARKWLER